TPDTECPAHTDRQTDGHQNERATQEQPDDLAWRRAEYHAHADFLCALRHRVGHHGVQPDCGKQERDCRKHREHATEDAVLPPSLRQQFVHRPHVEYRDVGAGCEHGLLNQRNGGCHAARGADDDSDIAPLVCPGEVRDIDVRIGLDVLDVTLTHDRGDTDDGLRSKIDAVRCLFRHADLAAEGVLALEIHVGEALIHDHSAAAGSLV